MERKQAIWKTVIFKYKNIRITVRDVSVAIVIVMLLFTFVKCQKKDKGALLKKKEVIEDTCGFPKRNLVALQDLLERSDLCSDAWFLDYEDYRHRLKEQNELLVSIETTTATQLHKLQGLLIEALTQFYEEQSEPNLTKLKEAVAAYQSYQLEVCKEEETSNE